MKSVTWVDDDGMKHHSLIRDRDDESTAPEGINHDPIDLESIDWDLVKKTLMSQLIDRKLYTYGDVIHQQDGVSGAVLAALRRQIIEQYKLRYRDGV